MSARRAPRQAPWWESELPTLERTLRDHLRRRLPALPHHHDDLINDTLLALSEQILRDRTAVPSSWLHPERPADPRERDYLPRLAITILRRRVADLFRERVRRWSMLATENPEEREIPAEDPSAERKRLLSRMLQVCMNVLAQTQDTDRDLLGLVSGLDEDPTRSRPLTDRERQRLRRLRRRLIEAIQQQLGSSVTELLRDDD